MSVDAACHDTHPFVAGLEVGMPKVEAATTKARCAEAASCRPPNGPVAPRVSDMRRGIAALELRAARARRGEVALDVDDEFGGVVRDDGD